MPPEPAHPAQPERPVRRDRAEGPAPVAALLCDDVRELRILLRYALEEDGRVRVVGEAGDAATCIDRLGELQPDVVLLDLSMPGTDGLEALPRVRAAAPGAAIVVFSGFAGERVGATALARGADRYLEKGVPLDIVRAAVHEVVARRRGA